MTHQAPQMAQNPAHFLEDHADLAELAEALAPLAPDARAKVIADATAAARAAGRRTAKGTPAASRGACG
jgi:hypothetical protein